ncbi:hypothetical protein L5515_019611 [Caenorhabditis briggsae]|uniref:Protein kinase domain-containing protein n=1 Tax=Caenorhabditis briggsae TaxID=6238 RepID=A0AAE9FM49_CAEBR|nr:hypothetical protein L5515_019611 [Caenorhabditis briggsae]
MKALRKIRENPHNNLLLLYSVGMLKNPPPGYTDEVIITEACGPSIREIMTKARIETGNTKLCSFSMDNIKRIGKQIGDAMLHLEKLKIFHLDLKASNVAFSRNFKYEMDTSLTHAIISMSDFDIKVIDYGNSLAHSESGNPEVVKLVQPQNMRASEVFMGLPYNKKTDVWSYGCLIAQSDRPSVECCSTREKATLSLKYNSHNLR